MVPGQGMGTVRQGRAVARRWLAIEPEGGGRIRVGESAHLPEEFGAGRSGHGHGPLDVGLDDGRAVSASTSRLQEVRPHAPCAPPAQMPQAVALTALAALGLSGASFHEPFHACSPQVPVGQLLCVTIITARRWCPPVHPAVGETMVTQAAAIVAWPRRWVAWTDPYGREDPHCSGDT
jgi:hypothetical protein